MHFNRVSSLVSVVIMITLVSCASNEKKEKKTSPSKQILKKIMRKNPLPEVKLDDNPNISGEQLGMEKLLLTAPDVTEVQAFKSARFLGAAGPKGITVLIEASQSKNPVIRKAAAYGLAIAGGSDAVSRLKEMCSDKNSLEVRVTAITSLGYTRARKEAGSFLLKLCFSPITEERQAATLALRNMEHKVAIRVLIEEGLTNKDMMTRQYAINALRDITGRDNNRNFGDYAVMQSPEYNNDDMNFYAAATKERRIYAIKLWRVWFRRNHENFNVLFNKNYPEQK